MQFHSVVLWPTLVHCGLHIPNISCAPTLIINRIYNILKEHLNSLLVNLNYTIPFFASCVLYASQHIAMNFSFYLTKNWFPLVLPHPPLALLYCHHCMLCFSCFDWLVWMSIMSARFIWVLGGGKPGFLNVSLYSILFCTYKMFHLFKFLGSFQSMGVMEL